MALTRSALPHGPEQPVRTRRPGPLVRLVRESATEARIPVGVAWATAVVPVLGAVALAVLFVVARPSFYLLQQEDQVVEWAQFGLCLAIGALAVLAATRVFRERPWLAVALVLLAVVYLFVAGEEISWGQRVFGLATPAELAELNQQGETNLHNISRGIDLQLVFKLGSSLLAVALIVGVWWVRIRKRAADGLLRLVVPPVVAVPGLLAMALYWVVAVALPAGSAPISRFQEWVELSFYVSLTASVLCLLTRVSNRRRDGHWVVAITIWIVVLVVAFAIMTAQHGIKPGNV